MKHSYSFYLFCKLYDLMYPTELEYDYLFGRMEQLYKEYDSSSFNDEYQSEYDCMLKYLKSIERQEKDYAKD